jgi:sugar-phosphatase
MSIDVGAVLFDMDGVLVDSRAAIDRVRRRWAKRVGLDEEMVAALPHGRKTSDIVLGLAPERNLAEEVAWLDADEERDLAGIVEIPGAARLLAALAPDAWAIVTSSGRTLAPKRLAAASLPLPRAIVTGEMVRAGKPSPEGYLLAARALGCDATDCVVVEDAPAGIEAGRMAGARVIGVATTSPRDELTGCEVIVRDLSELTAEMRGDRVMLTW